MAKVLKGIAVWLSAMGLMLALSAPAFASIEVYQFKNEQEKALFQELTSTLRCPQCQNNTIADSDAKLASDMRRKVLQMLNEGKTKQEIINYMVERYGYFIDYNPPVTPSTIILWVAPAAAIVIGVVVLIVLSRRNKKNVTGEAEFNQEEEQRLNALLNEMENKKPNQNTKVE